MRCQLVKAVGLGFSCRHMPAQSLEHCQVTQTSLADLQTGKELRLRGGLTLLGHGQACSALDEH